MAVSSLHAKFNRLHELDAGNAAFPSKSLSFSQFLRKDTTAFLGSEWKSVPLLHKRHKSHLCFCCMVSAWCGIHIYMMQKVFSKGLRAHWPGERGSVKAAHTEMCWWDCPSPECRHRTSGEGRMLPSKHSYYQKVGNHLLRHKLAPVKPVYCGTECFVRRFRNRRVYLASKGLTYK